MVEPRYEVKDGVNEKNEPLVILINKNDPSDVIEINAVTGSINRTKPLN